MREEVNSGRTDLVYDYTVRKTNYIVKPWAVYQSIHTKQGELINSTIHERYWTSTAAYSMAAYWNSRQKT